MVSSGFQRTVLTLDLGTGEPQSEITMCDSAVGLAFNPRSGKLFAATPGCGSITVIQPRVDLELASVRLGGSQGLMAFDPEYRTLLVIQPGLGLVSTFNSNSQRLIQSIPVGAEPYEVLVP